MVGRLSDLDMRVRTVDLRDKGLRSCLRCHLETVQLDDCCLSLPNGERLWGPSSTDCWGQDSHVQRAEARGGAGLVAAPMLVLSIKFYQHTARPIIPQGALGAFLFGCGAGQLHWDCWSHRPAQTQAASLRRCLPDSSRSTLDGVSHHQGNMRVGTIGEGAAWAERL